MSITIDLHPEHEAWLKQAVAAGRFPSTEEALVAGIDMLRARAGTAFHEIIGISQAELDADITSAEASLARGEGRTLEPVDDRLARLHARHADAVARASGR